MMLVKDSNKLLNLNAITYVVYDVKVLMGYLNCN